MDITGKIKRIGKIEAKTNNFCKRKFVLEYKEKSATIAQIVEFELKNGHVESIDGYFEGDMIRVHFNVRGREFIGKDGSVIVYNSLDVWRIDPMEDPNKLRRAEKKYGKSERDNVELPF
jgi:hypothetical protein